MDMMKINGCGNENTRLKEEEVKSCKRVSSISIPDVQMCKLNIGSTREPAVSAVQQRSAVICHYPAHLIQLGQQRPQQPGTVHVAWQVVR